MATNKRMFSNDIVGSDAFLEMPTSTQALYFHLNMKADDDGFVNPKMIMRMVGCGEDDLKILIVKKFVIPFENGVVVVKHWLINNNKIQKDRYKTSLYTEQKSELYLKENRSYTTNENKGKKLLIEDCTHSVNSPLTQNRIEENRIEYINTENANAFSGVKIPKAKKVRGKMDTKKIVSPTHAQVIRLFEIVNPNFMAFYENATEHKAVDTLLKAHKMPAIETILKKAVRYNKMEFVSAKAKIYKPSDLLKYWAECENKTDAPEETGTVLKTENQNALTDKLNAKLKKA